MLDTQLRRLPSVQRERIASELAAIDDHLRTMGDAEGPDRNVGSTSAEVTKPQSDVRVTAPA